MGHKQQIKVGQRIRLKDGRVARVTTKVLCHPPLFYVHVEDTGEMLTLEFANLDEDEDEFKRRRIAVRKVTGETIDGPRTRQTNRSNTAGNWYSTWQDVPMPTFDVTV